MGLKLKTKQERKDTPLSETPEGEAPVTDLKTALADINKRSIARQNVINESNAKNEKARLERSKQKKSVSSGGRLQGLASFKNTLGKQFYKETE